MPDSPREIAKETSNWVTVELLGLLNKGNNKAEGIPKYLTIRESPVTPQMLAGALLSLNAQARLVDQLPRWFLK